MYLNYLSFLFCPAEHFVLVSTYVLIPNFIQILLYQKKNKTNLYMQLTAGITSSL